MSREIQGVADVGSLSLRGLGAFSSILATYSADNVFPAALMQMENLGTLFPVSGEYAERVKDLLQRCTDRRLDHFAFSIGWRKNDSASLMANSAGGQAIALLSMCLMNLFGHSDTGLILSRVCSKLCPRSANISSVAQLADVAKLLAGKIQALGFGNLLAKEVAKIHDVYSALGRQSAPSTLLLVVDSDLVPDMLEKVSQALCQENKICRISGLFGMGYIVGLIQALFPRDHILTVDGVVIQGVDHPKIRCEVVGDAEAGLPTRIYLETAIPTTVPIKLPIVSIALGDYQEDSFSGDGFLSFGWSNWLVDCLHLIFLDHGLACDQSIIEACCNLLVLVPASLTLASKDISASFMREIKDGQLSSPILLLDLLGSQPLARMCLICKHILGCTPTEHGDNLRKAYEKFLARVVNVSSALACGCTEERGHPANVCRWSKGWLSEDWDGTGIAKECPRSRLWIDINEAMHCGFWSFFLDPGANITIRPRHFQGPIYNYITKAIRGDSPVEVVSANLLNHVIALICGSTRLLRGSKCFILSSESCTMYPTVLQTMNLPSRQLVTFTAVEGRILYEHRYHQMLSARPGLNHRYASKSLMDQLVPSHIGAHSGSPLLTIREGRNSLELRLSIQYAGNEVEIDLYSVVLGYIEMAWTRKCTHPFNKPMDRLEIAPFATSVASPAAVQRLGIAMTRWNPMAQFLCCGSHYQAILQRDCCLDCAMEQLGSTDKGVIIVG